MEDDDVRNSGDSDTHDDAKDLEKTEKWRASEDWYETHAENCGNFFVTHF